MVSLHFLYILRLLNIVSCPYPMQPTRIFGGTFMKQCDPPFFDLSKLSSETLKKIPKELQRHVADFQPFLKYSSWDQICSTLTKMIRGCKKTIHSFDSHLKESHDFTRVRALDQKEVYLLSRQIAERATALSLSIPLEWKSHHVEKGREVHPALQKVLSGRRRYSSVSKELKHSTCLVCLRLSEEESGK